MCKNMCINVRMKHTHIRIPLPDIIDARHMCTVWPKVGMDQL